MGQGKEQNTRGFEEGLRVLAALIARVHLGEKDLVSAESDPQTINDANRANSEKETEDVREKEEM